MDHFRKNTVSKPADLPRHDILLVFEVSDDVAITVARFAVLSSCTGAFAGDAATFTFHELLLTTALDEIGNYDGQLLHLSYSEKIQSRFATMCQLIY